MDDHKHPNRMKLKFLHSVTLNLYNKGEGNTGEKENKFFFCRLWALKKTWLLMFFVPASCNNFLSMGWVAVEQLVGHTSCALHEGLSQKSLYWGAKKRVSLVQVMSLIMLLLNSSHKYACAYLQILMLRTVECHSEVRNLHILGREYHGLYCCRELLFSFFFPWFKFHWG